MNHEANRVEINFLDLKISVKRGRFVTSTYFKPTDRNSYIPVDSCHHGSWLRSVPKGQYMRLKHNCTEPNEFLTQADVLTNRFVEKGYSLESLQVTLGQVAQMNRADLLSDRPPDERRDTPPTVPFITTFSTQHFNTKNLIQKHCHILCNDKKRLKI